MNYQVNYTFYTSAVNNGIHSLSPSRVLNRIVTTRTSANRHVSGVIVVNVNRPLSGCSGIVEFLQLIGYRSKLGVNCHRVSLSAYKLTSGVSTLTERDFPVALSVSLRTCSSRIQDDVVPMGGGCNVSHLLRSYGGCCGAAKHHVSFRCALVSNGGSSHRNTLTLTGLLGDELHAEISAVPVRMGLVPMGPISRANFSDSGEHIIRTFTTALRDGNVHTAMHHALNTSVGTSYKRLHQRSTGWGGSPRRSTGLATSPGKGPFVPCPTVSQESVTK